MPIDRTATQAGRRGTAAPASRKRSQPVRTEPVAHERPPRAPKSPGELGPGRSWRPGGADGNEILTTAAAVVLLVLLISEGITIVHMRGLLSAHMFIGLVLIPPVLLKLGSTGYRMVSYYAGSRSYRAKGPPLLPLRLMAPVLAASTVAVLTSGVLLLAAGHKSGLLLTVHKLSFIVFGVLFAVHLLAYLPRAVRSLRGDWTTARQRAVPGAGARAMLVAAAAGGGAALALALLPRIQAYLGH
jgi:hypothetical protein